MGVLYHDPSRSQNGKRKKFASTKDRLIDNSHTSAYMQQLLILYTVKGVKRHQGRKKNISFCVCCCCCCCALWHSKKTTAMSSFIFIYWRKDDVGVDVVGGWFVQSLHFFFQLFFKNSIFLCNAFQFSTGANSVAKIRAMNGYEIISFLAAFMFVCLNEIKRDNDTLIGYTLQKKGKKYNYRGERENNLPTKLKRSIYI